MTLDTLAELSGLALDPVLVVDQGGYVISANAHAHRLLAYDDGALSGMPRGRVVDLDAGVAHRADGEVVPVESTLQDLDTPAGRVAVIVLRDRTPLLALESRIEAAQQALAHEREDRRQLRALSQFVQSLQSRDQMQSVLSLHLESLLPLTRGAILLLDRGNAALERWVEWGVHPLVSTVDLAAEDCAALRLGKTVFRCVDEVSASRCDACHGGSDRDMVCTPLTANNEVLGILWTQIASHGEERLGKVDVQRAQAVAERLALPVANLRLRETLEEQSLHDPLTGAFNRRYLHETLTREVTRASRNRESLSIVMLDLDHFKRINDSRGHRVGDDLLRALVRFLSDGLRTSDIVCRYGGEEFVLVMPASAAVDAVARLDALREEWGTRELDDRCGGLVRSTFSAGISAFPDDGAEADVLLAAADAALYAAKEAGRNKVMARAAVAQPVAAAVTRPH